MIKARLSEQFLENFYLIVIYKAMHGFPGIMRHFYKYKCCTTSTTPCISYLLYLIVFYNTCYKYLFVVLNVMLEIIFKKF